MTELTIHPFRCECKNQYPLGCCIHTYIHTSIYGMMKSGSFLDEVQFAELSWSTASPRKADHSALFVPGTSTWYLRFDMLPGTFSLSRTSITSIGRMYR